MKQNHCFKMFCCEKKNRNGLLKLYFIPMIPYLQESLSGSIRPYVSVSKAFPDDVLNGLNLWLFFDNHIEHVLYLLRPQYEHIITH